MQGKTRGLKRKSRDTAGSSTSKDETDEKLAKVEEMVSEVITTLTAFKSNEDKVAKVEEVMRELNAAISKMSKDVGAYFKNISASTSDIQSTLAIMKQVKLASIVQAMFTCKICSAIPSAINGILSSVCCGQILGCTKCIEDWYQRETKCFLCNNTEIGVKAIPLLCGNELLDLLQQQDHN